MSEILAIINQKGGVGKSTTAAAIGAGLLLKGHTVLFIDLDAQGNLSFNLGAGQRSITSLEVLTGTATAQEAIIHTATGDLIPASPALAGADAIITTTGKEYRLKEALETVRANYDFIILDPPAFTKSRDTLRNAIKGYREINAAAMRLLPRGGYLATCSCSHFMTDTYFKQMLHNAAEDAGVSLRQIEARQQGPDHPILWNAPETDYLGFYIFQIV